MNYRVTELISKLATIDPTAAQALATLLTEVGQRIVAAEMQAASAGQQLASLNTQARERAARSAEQEEQRARDWEEVVKARQAVKTHAKAAREAEAQIMVPGQTWNADAARAVGTHQLATREARDLGRALYAEYCMKWGKGAPGRPVGS